MFMNTVLQLVLCAGTSAGCMALEGSLAKLDKFTTAEFFLLLFFLLLLLPAGISVIMGDKIYLADCYGWQRHTQHASNEHMYLLGMYTTSKCTLLLV